MSEQSDVKAAERRFEPADKRPACCIAGLRFGGNGPRLAHLLRRFDPISLEQMEGVALLDRVDTKYVMDELQLVWALHALAGAYRILDIDGVRLNRYFTLYFDTADLTLYQWHHAGKRNRCKVRSRHYLDTNLAYLEVKSRAGRGRTVKRRLRTDGLVSQLTPETDVFVDEHLPFAAQRLEPRLWDEFSRITLVSRQCAERVTFDVDLQFGHDGDLAGLPGVVVAEVKQARVDHGSEFIRQMRAMGIRPLRVSKYCTGVCMLYPEVKHNNFKPKLREIEKVMRENHHV